MGRRVAIRVLVALCVAVGAGAAVMVYRHIDTTVRDCYAVWHVAEMVNTFMDLNEGRWPSGWDDLREPYEIKGRRWPFEELEGRVDVDFSANPDELAKAAVGEDGKVPFRVVFLRNGKQHYYAGAEPNMLIWEHLQERAKDPDAHRMNRPVPEERLARTALLDAGGHWELDKDGHVEVVQLASLPNSPQYSDELLVHLEPLTQLRGLDLGYSKFGDSGLEHVRQLRHLEWIYLYGTKVTDVGLANLEEMPDLEQLVLANANFTDAAIDHIVRMPNLRLLNLNRCRVTDEGIDRLHDMKTLKEVMLGETQVTEQGVRKLRAALPDCDVYFLGAP